MLWLINFFILLRIFTKSSAEKKVNNFIFMFTLQNIYFLWKNFFASKSLSFREFFEHIELLPFSTKPSQIL
jgi:hypothetical protein